MAGGKETPRQKMIGMMYLVLTALLALNVSKQVIAAFVTINDKLDRSANIINQNNQSNYSSFDKKITTVKAQGGDVESVKVWQDRAFKVQKRTTQTEQSNQNRKINRTEQRTPHTKKKTKKEEHQKRRQRRIT